MKSRNVNDIKERFARQSNTLLDLHEVAYNLGLQAVWLEDREVLIKIIKNHRYYCDCTNHPAELVDYEGFELLYKFALQYEEIVNRNSTIQKQQLDELKQKAIN